jgi:hypothetical protein
MEKIINRVYKYLDFKGLSPAKMEKMLVLSNGYLGTQLKRNADIGESVIKKILDNCLDINPIWLLTGEGEMLKTDQIKKYPEHNTQPQGFVCEQGTVFNNCAVCREKERLIESLQVNIITLQKTLAIYQKQLDDCRQVGEEKKRKAG